MLLYNPYKIYLMINISREKKSLSNNVKKWKKTGKLPVNNRLLTLKLRKP